MLSPLLILLAVTHFSLSESTIADDILQKEEECKDIRVRVGSAALDEGGDRFPGIPIQHYYTCKADLDTLKRQYMSKFYKGVSFGYQFFLVKLSNGTLIMLPTPSNVESLNATDTPKCPSCEVLCMFYNRCKVLLEDIDELSDPSLKDYYNLELEDCEKLLDKQKEKFFEKHNVSQDLLREAQHISLICKEVSTTIPLKQSAKSSNDNLYNAGASDKETDEIITCHEVKHDEEGTEDKNGDDVIALNIKSDIESREYLKDGIKNEEYTESDTLKVTGNHNMEDKTKIEFKEESHNNNDKSHFGKYDHDVIITATPMPDTSGDEIFQKESDCDHILQMANNELDSRSIDSVRYYDSQYAQCMNSLDEIKTIYARKHGINFEDYESVFPVELSNGFERLVSIPKNLFKESHSAILPEWPSFSLESATGQTLEEGELGGYQEEDKDHINGSPISQYRMTRTPMNNPAFISNNMFNEYYNKNSRLEVESTLARIVNMIRRSGRSERTAAD